MPVYVDDMRMRAQVRDPDDSTHTWRYRSPCMCDPRIIEALHHNLMGKSHLSVRYWLLL